MNLCCECNPNGCSRRWEIVIILAVFFVVAVTHSVSRNRTSWDSRWTIQTSLSMLDGKLDLDEYKPLLEKADYLSAIQVNGHWYNWYPPGASMVAAPFVWVAQRLDSLAGEDLSAAAHQRMLYKLEAVIASILVALTSVFIYLIARRRLCVLASLVAVFIFAYCTSAWSTASRAMWSHTPSMLMLAAGLWMILKADDKPVLAGLSGLVLAFSFVCRPTNALPAGLLAIYVLVRHRRQFALFAFSAAVVIGAFILFNWFTVGQRLPDYYHGKGFAGDYARTAEALAGQLVSPSRGLLIASPILLLLLAGVWLQIRRRRFGLLGAVLLAAIVLHWVTISVWPIWWGGHSQGPRLWTDMLPFMMVFVIEGLTMMGRRWQLEPSPDTPPVPGRKYVLVRAGHPAIVAMVAVLMVVSFASHFRLANAAATMKWNASPVNVDAQPSRVWDWHDVQMLRGL